MKTVGITACSNGLVQDGSVEALTEILRESGACVLPGSCLYKKLGPFSGTGRERAEALMKLYENPEVSDIYDVSGGDMANEVLDYLDYEKIKNSSAVFWGYSDLTTVLNAVYAKTGKPGVLYSVRNLLDPTFGALQRQRYLQGEALFAPACTMIQGSSLEGTVVGGNIRCFLKLAGTEYFPDVTDKILLLEARSGTVPQMVTFLSQLRSCGVFRKIRGILLGTFSQMEAEGGLPDMLTLAKQFAGEDMPIAATREIGHGKDARAIWIGREFSIGSH